MKNDINLIKLFIEKITAENGLSKNTTESYGRDIKLFKEFCKLKNKNLTNINQSGIELYIKQLYQQNIKSSSLSRKISALRNFYNFLEEQEKIHQNPLKNIASPKKQNNLPKFLSEKNILQLLDFAQKDKSEFGIKLSCILEILYGSGIRISELINLPISSIQKDYNNNLKNYLLIRGKGNKERIVPLSRSAITILGEYLILRKKIGHDSSKWLFSGHIRSSKNAQNIKIRSKFVKIDKPMTRQRINQMLKELALKSGLDPQKISPHILRHSFATHLLNRGINIRYLQEMLGHATIGTTEIYTHILDGKLKELVLKHHPMNKK